MGGDIGATAQQSYVTLAIVNGGNMIVCIGMTAYQQICNAQVHVYHGAYIGITIEKKDPPGYVATDI
jgi:hypothetical protein